MNEQIRKLFEQALAEFTAENKYATVVVPDPVQRDFVEKFARLIVRECLKQIYGRTKIAPGDYNWPDKDVGYNEGINDAYKQIKKHFGVGE